MTNLHLSFPPNRLLLAACFFLFLLQTHAAVETISSGNWASPAIWSTGVVPTVGTPVTIKSGHSVTVNDSQGSGHLTIESGGEVRILISGTLNNPSSSVAGTFLIYGAVGLPQAFEILTGGLVDFAAGTHVFNSTSSFTGAGTLKLRDDGAFGTTLTFEAGATCTTKLNILNGTLNDNAGIQPGLVTMSGGKYLGTGSPNFANGFEWTGGELDGAGTVTVSDTLNLGTTTRYLKGSKTLAFDCAATLSTTMIMEGTSTLKILTDGLLTLNINSASLALAGTSSNQFVLENGATLTKNGSSDFNIQPPFACTGGTINVNGATLKFLNTSTSQSIGSTSTVNIGSGALLNISAGGWSVLANIGGSGTFKLSNTGAAVTLQSGSSFSSDTKLEVTGTFTDNVGISPGNVLLMGATYNGTGSPTFANGLSWDNSDIGGSGVLTISGAASNSIGGQTRNISGSKKVLVTGTVTLTNAAVTNIAAGCSFEIATGGTLNVNLTDNNYAFGSGVAGDFILSGGTIQKTGIYLMTISSKYTQSSGTVNISDGGRININANTTHTISGGSVSLSGASRLVFYNNGTYNVTNTTFSGAGSVETNGDNNSSYPYVNFGTGVALGASFINTRGYATFNTGSSLTGGLTMVTPNFSILVDNVGLAPGNFVYTGGYYGGSSSPTFANGLIWTSGQFYCNGTINVSGSLTSSGSLSRELGSNCIFHFTGTGTFNDRFPTVYDQAQFIIGNGSTLGMNMTTSFTALGSATAKMEVQTGGTLNRTGNGHASLQYKFIMAGGAFNHSGNGSTRCLATTSHAWTGGSVALSDGSGIYFIGNNTLDLTNTAITGTGNLAGINFGSASGAGNMNVNSGSSITSSIYLVRGSVVANVDVEPKLLYLGSGTYNGDWSGDGDITASDGLLWTSGNISGSGDINAYGTVSSFIPAFNYTRSLGGSRHMKIYGNYTAANGYSMSGTAKTTVMSGGTLNLNSSSGSFLFGGTSANTFEVNGTLAKTTGSSTVTIPCRFLINGTLNVNVGFLYLSSIASDNAIENASVTIDGGGSLVVGVYGSSFGCIVSNSSISGDGSFNHQGGATTFTTGSSLTCGLSLVGGSIIDNIGLQPGYVGMDSNSEYKGSGSPTFANGFNWGPGSKFLGGGVVNISGTVNVSDYGSPSLLEIREDKEVRFTTAAPKNITGGGFALFDNAKVRVSSGAMLVFLGGGNIFFPPYTAYDVDMTGGPATSFIVEPGCTIRKSDASWTLGFNMPFQNNGVLEVTGGDVHIWQGNAHEGTFTINGTCQLRFRSNTSIWQNIANNGTISVDSGQILTLNGTTAQSISGDGTLNGDLALDNAAGLTFSGTHTINGILTLQNGKATLLSNNLTVNAIANASSDRYVVTGGLGKLRMSVNATPKDFPVGPSGTSYNPLQIAQTSSSDIYAVHAKEGFDPANPAYGSDYVNRQWTIERTAGNSIPANVTFQWENPAHENGSFDPNDCYAARWDGSAWQPFAVGAASCAGATCMRTQAGITAFSPFSIASGTGLITCTNLTDPPPGSSNVPIGTALTWIPQGVSTIGYRLDVGTSPGGTDILNHFDVGQVYTYNPPGDLPFGATIYVQVKPYTASGISEGCPEDNFTTCPSSTFYLDNDGDDYGAGAPVLACEAPNSNYVLTNGDCDDYDPLEFPGQIWYKDADGDGYADGSSQTACLRPANHFVLTELLEISGDCDDANPTVYPGAPELCDGLDNDCDGTPDDGLTFEDYYFDGDSDSYGDGAATIACEWPGAGYVLLNGDCDDYNFTIHPGATELCDGLDNDCDGDVDEDIVPHPDFNALMALYNSTDGPNWPFNFGWSQGAAGTDCDPCWWPGVSCDVDGRVSELYLNYNGLNGSLPAELGELSHLTNLNLWGNQLSGNIPAELGDLNDLYALYLAENQLSGNIPAALGNLANLNELYLSGNQLSGSIPSALGNLANLYSLSLSGNQLSGSIPTALGDLANLGELHLQQNNLSGNIPPALGNLANLYYLNLSGNQLSGSIPSALGDLANLGELNLEQNNLSGSIPPALSNIPYLYYLNLSDNQLSGSIPPQVGDMANLWELYLGQNNLSGSIPATLGNSAFLIQLHLNDNQLSGCIPGELDALCGATVDLSGNPGLPGGGDFAAFCNTGEGGDYDDDTFCAHDDCDDFDPAIYPGATEVCNGLDDDCDGFLDSDGFLDAGGAGSNYGNNEYTSYTFCPETAGEKTAIAFTQFSTENNGDNACFDGLTIYNGNSTASPLIMPPAGGSGVWCWDRNDPTPSGTGDLQDRTIVSTATDGCLTFVFTSNGSGTRPGWEASITCTFDPGPPDFILGQAGGVRYSDRVIVTGDGWHHFVHTADNLNLLSMQLGGTGAKFPPDGVSVNASGTGVIDLGTEGCGAPYANNMHYYVFRRTWNGQPDIQPTSNVPVRFYYTTAEFNDVDAASPDVNHHTDLSFFKINGGDPEDFTLPGNECHGLVSPANYQEFDGGQWTYSPYGSEQYAQYDVSSFSGGGGGGGTGGQGALPIELLFFQGKAMGDHNLMTWASASERNVAWHILERAPTLTDVAAANTWQEIGRLAGSANSQSRLDYQLRDEFPLPLAYYRLRTVDFDGQKQVSNIIAVARPLGRLSVHDIFPNPSSGTMTVLTELPDDDTVKGILTDLNGAVVAVLNWEGAKGMNALPLDLSGLATGCYTLRLNDGAGVLAVRVVKQ